MTYRQLLDAAEACAATLRGLGGSGDRVLVVCPPGPRFIISFLACLLADRIAVPTYTPSARHGIGGLRRIGKDCGAVLAIAPRNLVSALRDEVDVAWLAYEDLPAPAGRVRWPDQQPDPEAIAFLQYTSGSTGSPKGVEVRYRNLSHNLDRIEAEFGHTPESSAVIWLPPHHDMGLVGGLLQPLHAGFTATLMSPMEFLTNPLSWLRAISRYGATTSGGPNVAFELCTRRISAEQARMLDLSHWRVAFVGAEPINPRVLDEFAVHFSPSGFRRESFFPCYGLAEATLFVSGGPRDRGARIRSLSIAALESGYVHESPDGRRIVSSGLVDPDGVAVVDPVTCRLCAPGRVGEIWLTGASVADAYWSRPPELDGTFGAVIADRPEAGPYLRTGDLGFVVEGELYVTGRRKELIVIHGRNMFPQDLERTVESCHPDLRPGGCAAFAVDVDGKEQVVIMQETNGRLSEADTVELEAAIRDRIAGEHGLALHRVVFVPKGLIPRTTSGKIQRSVARARYVATL
ncbi:acyl-CoA synthetase [Nocardia sputorum]|nr:acyl-CoA synthetase [Nocardia sputorum]